MNATAELLTTSEVAELLNVSPQRVRQLVRDRSDFPAPARVVGAGMRLWRRTDVEHWRDSADRSPGRRAEQ